MPACKKCNKPLDFNAKLINRTLWHPHCVQCANCQKRLDDRLFHVRKQAFFCLRCYQMMFRQRCAKCNKSIKDHTLKAMDVFWHLKCFCCVRCNVQLSQKYYLTTNKTPHCFLCYQKDKELDEIAALTPIAMDMHSPKTSDADNSIQSPLHFVIGKSPSSETNSSVSSPVKTAPNATPSDQRTVPSSDKTSQIPTTAKVPPSTDASPATVSSASSRASSNLSKEQQNPHTVRPKPPATPVDPADSSLIDSVETSKKMTSNSLSFL